jgi:hypothetical protein
MEQLIILFWKSKISVVVQMWSDGPWPLGEAFQFVFFLCIMHVQPGFLMM